LCEFMSVLQAKVMENPRGNNVVFFKLMKNMIS